MITNELYQTFLSSKGICTDTRQLSQGMLYVALKGEHFDGNALVDVALAKGAIAVITENTSYIGHPQCLITENALAALQSLAQHHRKQFKGTVITITGTNGKTTTKELLRETLSVVGSVQATTGNLNNHIGVPLTLLSMNPDTQFCIVEAGANHQGEIDELCQIAQPDFGLITNIGKAHLEGFGGFEGVIKTKTELYRYIASNGKAVFVHADDDMLMQLSDQQPRIVYGKQTFNAHAVADPFLSVQWQYGDKFFNTRTQLTGLYNLPNMLAATGIAIHFGGSADAIHEKLEQYRPSNMRSQWIDTGRNHLILDAYNANPSSMNQAILNFTYIKGKRMAVLGDMLELGKYSSDEHKAILHQASNDSECEYVFIGPEFMAHSADFKMFTFFNNTAETGDHFKNNSLSGYHILLKGSRGIGVDQLKDLF